MNRTRPACSSAVILAGGGSSRMGFDKQEIIIGDKLIAVYLADILSCEFPEVIINTNRPQLYPHGYETVSDILRGIGPIAGLHAGLLASSGPYVYFIACDMPFVNMEYIRYMKSLLVPESMRAVVTRFRENMFEPLNAIYSVEMLDLIEKNIERKQYSLSSLLSSPGVHAVEESVARRFSPDWHMFQNMNAVEDLLMLT